MSKPIENYNTFKPDFDTHSSILRDFLQNYSDKTIEKDKIHDKHKYMINLQKISNRQSKVLEIHFDDLESFLEKEFIIYQYLQRNTKRYLKILYEIVDSIMPKRSLELKEDVTNLIISGA